MKSKSVGILAVVTVVAVVAAAVAIWFRPGVDTLSGDDAPAFPLVRNQPDAVARITIADAEGRFSLVRDGAGHWGVEDRDGFPADTAKVRALVAGMADMRLTEAKTARPDRFHRLEVEDLDTPGAKSRRIRVSAADGRMLADVLVGRRAYGVTGGREAGTYLRRAGDRHAWLAGGTLDVDAAAGAWLRREVVDISPDQVSRVSVAPAEGESYAASREAPDQDLRLDSLPEGRAARPQDVRRLASLLSRIELMDVARAEAIPLPEDAASVTVETFAGLRVGYRLAAIDDLPWAVFTAEVGPDADPAARDAAREIAGRVDGWVFRMHRSVANQMAPPLQSLLEPAGAGEDPATN
ncbi:MAG: DUF4340 domain-containing protein [Rhodospirillales bacterium]|nr:MAG: DUF4340 domain-containing protein [Rhodospirillales bacterium]